VVIAETSYIGRLGVESLAAMALVFPFVILTMTMSGGAMGGGVASAIARALGAGDVARASALAAHALLIGICFGLSFMLVMLIFGPALLALLGAAATCWPTRSAMRKSFSRRGAALADEQHGRRAARHRQHETASLMILSSAVSRSFSAARSALALARCRNSACAASRPDR